jgi:hypothetical protein
VFLPKKSPGFGDLTLSGLVGEIDSQAARQFVFRNPPVRAGLFSNARGIRRIGFKAAWLDHGSIRLNPIMIRLPLLGHDLFGKPVAAFPDHAPRRVRG